MDPKSKMSEKQYSAFIKEKQERIAAEQAASTILEQAEFQNEKATEILSLYKHVDPMTHAQSYGLSGATPGQMAFWLCSWEAIKKNRNDMGQVWDTETAARTIFGNIIGFSKKP